MYETFCTIGFYSYRRIVNQTHHSSVIIIITITAYHCSLFNVYQTVTACYCAKTAGCSHCRREFYFSPIKYAIPIPIRTSPIPIPIPISSPNYSHSHGNPMVMGVVMGYLWAGMWSFHSIPIKPHSRSHFHETSLAIHIPTRIFDIDSSLVHRVRHANMGALKMHHLKMKNFLECGEPL